MHRKSMDEMPIADCQAAGGGEPCDGSLKEIKERVRTNGGITERDAAVGTTAMAV